MKYPEDFINKIICGDCLEVMKEMPDMCIDMTVTSPPYDNLREYGGHTHFPHFNFKGIANQLFRVTKLGGVVAWIVGDATMYGSESGTSFRQALCFKEIGFNLHDTMIYKKINFIPKTHNRYEQCFEYMFILSKGTVKVFNAIKIDSINAGKVIKRTDSLIEKSVGFVRNNQLRTKDKKIKENIFEYKCGTNCSTKDRVAFNHPAIFPEKLAYDHIISWSNEGDVIFDPLCGSGTTCKMAKVLNRYFIGIEINPDYCKIAEERLAQGVL